MDIFFSLIGISTGVGFLQEILSVGGERGVFISSGTPQNRPSS